MSEEKKLRQLMLEKWLVTISPLVVKETFFNASFALPKSSKSLTFKTINKSV